MYYDVFEVRNITSRLNIDFLRQFETNSSIVRNLKMNLIRQANIEYLWLNPIESKLTKYIFLTCCHFLEYY